MGVRVKGWSGVGGWVGEWVGKGMRGGVGGKGETEEKRKKKE